jgi:hypothetical protein
LEKIFIIRGSNSSIVTEKMAIDFANYFGCPSFFCSTYDCVHAVNLEQPRKLADLIFQFIGSLGHSMRQ